MTSFKISSDDIGVRALQENNKSPVITGPVMPVKASKPVQKSPQNTPLTSTPIDRRRSDPRQTQRRQEDRRKAEKTVLLDTRGQHDRRTKTGRMADAQSDAMPTLRGIDETT